MYQATVDCGEPVTNHKVFTTLCHENLLAFVSVFLCCLGFLPDLRASTDIGNTCKAGLMPGVTVGG